MQNFFLVFGDFFMYEGIFDMSWVIFDFELFGMLKPYFKDIYLLTLKHMFLKWDD